MLHIDLGLMTVLFLLLTLHFLSLVARHPTYFLRFWRRSPVVCEHQRAG